jgi:hypothetical protein
MEWLFTGLNPIRFDTIRSGTRPTCLQQNQHVWLRSGQFWQQQQMSNCHLAGSAWRGKLKRSF